MRCLQILILAFVAGTGFSAASARADEERERGTAIEPAVTANDRTHWAFRPLGRPLPPGVKDASWPRTPIDRFILAKLEAAGLAPLPPADRTTLLRRVTFDLTGLPPTRDEIDAFASDDRTDAWERVVDRLLASPSYGERWAQHWLDLARFAETDGFEHDLVRPNAWRYRDWVVAALNDDMPSGEFVRRQIAGDLLDPGNPSAAIPTGFLLCGPDMPDLNLQDERRHNVLNEMTGTIGSVFLGLQLGCAQCHDHKYDPISQADFYRLRAFFDSAEFFKEQPVPTPDELAARQRGEQRAGPAIRQNETRLRALEETARKSLRDRNPDLQPTRQDLLDAMPADDRQTFQKLEAELRSSRAPATPMGRVMHEGAAQSSFLMLRGDFRRRGPQLEPAFIRVVSIPSEPRPQAAPPAPTTTATKPDRITLANWLASPDNSLAARVIVNRLWQHHFGEGLARSPSDFGVMGDRPTHPELLEWLASEGAGHESTPAILPHRGSFKHLHRLILTSAVYRQSSRSGSPEWSDEKSAAARAAWEKANSVDPDNRLLWSMNRQRLDGEAIRDAMLLAAGTLSQRRGGPGVRPPLSQELVSTLLKNQWDVTPDPADHSRRSLYLFVRRNLRFPLFEAFDRPDTNASCPRRNRSTIAPQALVLLNSELSLAAAKSLSKRVALEAGDETAHQVRTAYRLTLGRSPTPDETADGVQFLSAGESNAALTDFCLALFNVSEFLYID